MFPYIRIPKVIEAIQIVYANCDALIELGTKYHNALKVVVDSDNIVSKVMVKAGLTSVIAKPTDWIIKEDDSFFVMSDEDFKNTYQEYVTEEKED